MDSRRPPIYLITGLILGVALGILYAWVLTPVETIETTPADLRADFKEDYRVLIARSYQANYDLNRAEARLALLGDAAPARALAVQAQLTLGEEGQEDAARALGLLAAALQGDLQAAPTSENEDTLPTPTGSVTPEASAPTATRQVAQATTPAPAQTTGGPTATVGTVIPTLTPTLPPTATPTAGPPFVLDSIQLVCNPNIDPPLIQVNVADAAGNPVPGVAILISWDTHTNRFVTGLNADYGLGYADYQMDPAITYSLQLEEGSAPVNSITGRQCEDATEPYWGSWQFNFVQP
ncbi:hypothetical protein KQH61_04440 [bacterium]|nr:hypothetical protein [bacterium]MCB2179153.1 hypothetical protein [bacterium]